MATPDQKVQQFRDWFLSNGGYIHPDFVLRHFTDGKGIALVYEPSDKSRPPPLDAVIAACPHHLSLSSLNLHTISPLFPPRIGSDQGHGQLTQLPAKLQNAGVRCLASLLLAVEYLLGEKSKWYYYINVLPGPPATAGTQSDSQRCIGVIDTPLWYSESEMRWLEGTDVHKTALELEHQWRQMWTTHEAQIMEWSHENGLEGLSWHLFKWAMTIFGSRSFSPSVIRGITRASDNQEVLAVHDPHSLLYPGVDLLNHNPHTRNHWDSRLNTNDATGFSPATSASGSPKQGDIPNSFRLMLKDHLKWGDEVFNTYGSQTNSQLLLSWGFCLEDNQHDRFAIKLLSNEKNSLVEHVIASYDKTQLDLKSNLAPKTKNGSPIAIDAAASDDHRILAFDLENNIYLVRSFAVANQLAGIDDDDYPSSKVEQFHHLSIFPEILLTKLAAQVANARERANVEAKHIDFPPGYLYKNLGHRNLLATTDLLMKKLKLTVASSSMEMSVGAEGNHRFAECNKYKKTQRRILTEDIAELNQYMASQLDITYEQFPVFPAISNLPRLLRHLKDIDPGYAMDFVGGFTSMAGPEDELASAPVSNETLLAVAEEIRQQGADDIFFVLAIATFGIINQSTGSNHLGNLINYYAASRSPGLLGADQEQVASLGSDVAQYVENMRLNYGVGRSGLWMSQLWDDAHFLASCVSICLEECIEIDIGEDPEPEGTLCLYTGDLKVGT